MEPVTRVTKELFGDIPVIPTMSTGATDSRFFRALGVPAYGVSGLFSDPTVDARAHGRDERMRVQSFYEGQEFLYRLTKALAGAERTAVP
jgi:acetylornithine deacetylase/succinyl-diaminopimelate desuccinylase-like protein